jgi:hypothetical protein
MSMQASPSNHPASEELMAYGDGEAAADTLAHVQGCATCTAQVASLTQAQAALTRTLYRFDCPPAHSLGEYQLDLLDPEPRRQVAAHLVDCDACQLEMQTLRGYLAMPSPMPDSLVQRARRVVATLFRPAPGLAYSGLRGTSAETTRVYQVDDVTLTVGPGQSRGSLVGLVLTAGGELQALEGHTVRLVSIERDALTSALDDLGNFEFDDVPAGIYALELDLPDALIVVEELRVD